MTIKILCDNYNCKIIIQKKGRGKNMKTKQGISLIVLVITIIVMIVLAGAIILTLDNSGIIEKANGAVEQTNLATVKEVVQMAWAEAYASGERTEAGLQAAVENALTQNKITEDMYKGYTIEVTTNGVELLVDHNGAVIPKGATYITDAFVVRDASGDVYDYSAAKTYIAGDNFPAIKNGDKYIYGDFTYVYNAEQGVVGSKDRDTYGVDTTINGWYVSCKASKKNVGEILEKINYGNVTSMQCTFFAALIETLTNIPKTIKKMPLAFVGCQNLKSLPEIPEGVEDIESAFVGCSSLTGTIVINTTPTDYKYCFNGIDMSKITLAGKCSRELKQLIANTGNNADQVTIID